MPCRSPPRRPARREPGRPRAPGGSRGRAPRGRPACRGSAWAPSPATARCVRHARARARHAATGTARRPPPAPHPPMPSRLSRPPGPLRPPHPPHPPMPSRLSRPPRPLRPPRLSRHLRHLRRCGGGAAWSARPSPPTRDAAGRHRGPAPLGPPHPRPSRSRPSRLAHAPARAAGRPSRRPDPTNVTPTSRRCHGRLQRPHRPGAPTLVVRDVIVTGPVVGTSRTAVRGRPLTLDNPVAASTCGEGLFCFRRQGRRPSALVDLIHANQEDGWMSTASRRA